jgi:hypothetical protein
MVVQQNWRVKMEVLDKNGDVVVLKNNVGGWCRYYLIKGGLTNKEIVEKVRERFGSKTTVASVAWYKSELSEKGIIVSSKRAAKAMSMDEFEAEDADE